MRKLSIFVIAASLTAVASAEVLDRPTGIRIGQRMTLRPYVSLSLAYDSNVGGRSSGNKSSGDFLWTVNPGLGLDYKAENWALLLNVYYNYHAYTKSENSNHHNQHTYGETLRWNWSNSKGVEKGWALMLSETYSKVAMSDDLSYYDGRSYTADRSQLTVNGAIQRRFNEHWHADLSASYYNLDYENVDSDPTRSALYGWQRWTASAEMGFAPSRWTDIIGAIGYHGYVQDNVAWTGLSRDSQGYTAQVGLGSYATERITYRALAGWSRFEYANNASASDGFVYTLSGNWKIDDTLQTMLLATSYYQPSERSQASKSRTDAISWGIAKALVRGKLRTTLDMTYRHEKHESIAYGGTEYDIDVFTARLGLNYTINRFLTGFIYGEYLRSWNSESDTQGSYCDYDRWRVTTGIRLTY